MKLRYLIPLLFCGSLVFAEGPAFQHKDPFIQQEFENAYQDIRTVLGLNGSARCIDGPTFCVDTVNNLVGIGVSPSYKLHVSGSNTGVVINNALTNSAASFILQNSDTNHAGFVAYGPTHSSLANEVALKNYHPTGDLAFYTNNIARMRIDFVGDLIIGPGVSYSDNIQSTADAFGTQAIHLALNAHPSANRSWTHIISKNNDSFWGPYGYRISPYDTGNLGNYAISTGAGDFIVGGGRAVTPDAGTNFVTNLRVYQEGWVTQPRQPSFSVTHNASQDDVTGDGTEVAIIWNVETKDLNNNFSGNTFTAPVEGFYQFSLLVAYSGIDVTHEAMQVRINTSNQVFIAQLPTVNSAALATPIVPFSVLAWMDANDTATASGKVATGNKVVDISASNCFFSGFLN